MKANDIFKSASFKEGTVTVEAWGGEFTIRELNARQAGEVITMADKDGMRSNAMAVAYSLVDEDGKRIFNDAHIDRILDSLRVSDIAKVATAVMELSNPEGPVEEK